MKRKNGKDMKRISALRIGAACLAAALALATRAAADGATATFRIWTASPGAARQIGPADLKAALAAMPPIVADGATTTAEGPGVSAYELPADARGVAVWSPAPDRNGAWTLAKNGETAAFFVTGLPEPLIVTAGRWGSVVIATNGVELATIGPDATTDLVIGYGAEVTAEAVPDAGFAVDGDADDIAFASYTESTNLVFAFRPDPTDAAIRWKFSSAVGRYFAQVAIPAHAGYAEALDGLAFLFADRTNRVGDVYAQLWNAAQRGPQGDVVTYDGVAYRRYALGEAAFDGKAENARVLWGVANATFADARNIVPAGERQIGLYVRRRVDPVSGNETAAEVENFVGYLTWTTEGTRWFLPVVEGGANGAVGPQARRTAARNRAFSVARRAYAPATLGLAATLGLGAETVAAEPPTARIAAFEVGADGSVAGRVAAVAGGEASSAFGAAATVRILSAASLAGPWTEEARAEVDAETGAFALPPGATSGTFFRTEIVTREVVE